MPTIGGLTREAAVARRLQSLQPLLEHPALLNSFPEAAEDVVHLHRLDPHMEELLEAGLTYHQFGTEKTLEGRKLEDGFPFIVGIPRISPDGSGSIPVDPIDKVGEEGVMVWAIVGAEQTDDLGVVLDAIATRKRDPVDAENARLIRIIPKKGRLVFDPRFVTGSRPTVSIETAVPPLRLASKSTPGLV